MTCSPCSCLAFGEEQIAELSPTGVTEDNKGLLVSEFVEEVGLHCTGVPRGRVTCDETIFLVQVLAGIKGQAVEEVSNEVTPPSLMVTDTMDSFQSVAKDLLCHGDSPKNVVTKECRGAGDRCDADLHC